MTAPVVLAHHAAARWWRCWRLAAIIWLGLVLTACATPHMLEEDTAAFQRSGRFSITVTELSGETEAVQGGFSWSDSGRHLRLDLSDPMGSTLARIMVDARGATLHRSDGTQERAAHPDALVEKVVGSAIPVADLRFWLQGQTAEADTDDKAGTANQTRQDGDGHLVSFVQRGWKVELSRYDEKGPTLLRMARSDAGRRIQVRLAISSRAS
ncbi:MAG TPA: lipoprotein insertase outer membrane protein LolB [Burkholderiaceae bacterium]|nr:lipoprotein insertase outer membrane protein LolB [Burkholderiaceae bacterium]